MDIFIHIGPHKTGTTSVQHWLLKESNKDNYYYPSPVRYGPGHAVLAWEVMGVHGYTSSIQPMLDCIGEAKKEGYSKIVFSSEEFSTGVITKKFDILQKLNQTGKVTIIVTLTELTSRFRSEIFESVKYKEFHEKIECPNVINILNRRPGLNPDFIYRILNSAKDSKLVFIVLDRANREKLFDNFEHILGIKTGQENKISLNESKSYIDTVIRNELNKILPKASWQDVDALSTKIEPIIAEGISEDKISKFPGFGHSINAFLDAMWSLQLDYLLQLKKQCLIDLYY